VIHHLVWSLVDVDLLAVVTNVQGEQLPSWAGSTAAMRLALTQALPLVWVSGMYSVVDV
jgi:hypothetical protein